MALTNTTTLSPLVKNYYDKRLLIRAEANLVYKQMGRVGVIPRSEGKTVYWSRYRNLTVADTALTEGTDPTAISLSALNVTATLAQYGNLVQVTDILSLTSIDNSIANAVDVLGYNASLTIDTVVRDVVVAGSTVQYASGVADRTAINATDVVTVADIRKAVRTLKGADAQPQNGKEFAAITHPDVEYDLQGDSNWTDAAIYTDKGVDRVYNGETGKLYGVRFMNSTNAPTIDDGGAVTASTDVYQTMFFGKEAFGVSDLQNLETIVDSPSKNSALNLYSDVGWKASFATKVLNDDFMVRLESAATV